MLIHFLIAPETESVTAAAVEPLIIFKHHVIDNTQFGSFHVHRLAKKIAARFECVVSRETNALVQLFADKKLMIIRIPEPFETAKDVRRGYVADEGICYRYLVKEKFLRVADVDPLAHQICVVVVTGDLGVLAVVRSDAAHLKLDPFRWLSVKIKQFQIRRRLRVARSPASVVPTAGNIRPREQPGVNAVLSFSVKFESCAKVDLILVLMS